MIDRDILLRVLQAYKESFQSNWEGEKYKWEAVAYFQKHWDKNAENFGDMFKEATAKTSNLLVSGYAYPRGMILNFAKANDEATRQMFIDLFNEERDLAERVADFQAAAKNLQVQYDDGTWRKHYQNTNAISTYLWLMYPDKYYIFRYEYFRDVAAELHSDYTVKRNGSVKTMLDGFAMYDEICSILEQDEELRGLLKSVSAEGCYDDPKLKTLMVDFGHYLSQDYLVKKKASQSEKGWFPENYDPGLSVSDWEELLEDSSVFTMGAMQIMRRMLDYGGQATCTQLAVKYGESKNFYNSGSTALARRVAETTHCSLLPRDEERNRYWPVLYTGKKATKEEDGAYIWRLRPELREALQRADMEDIPLYASGTENGAVEGPCGFWWLTANPRIWSFSEISIGEEQSYTLYNDNGNKRRVFQNFLDAKAGDLVIGYESNPVKKVVALGRITQGSDGKAIYFAKTEGLLAPIEYQTLRECPELEKMEFFVQPNGTLFKLTKGEYDFIMDVIREENPLKHPNTLIQTYSKDDFLSSVYMSGERYDVLLGLLRNKMNVILQGAPGVGKTFTAKRLAYAMMGEQDDSRIEIIQFHQNYSYEDFIMGYRPDGESFKLTDGIFYRFCQTAANHPDKPYFFIIDEINRGNMSKVFGELLMLIEKDYRGTKATLAYSGMPFSVPENLYIIGMMNTADRSLAMIDYALRRRFSFFEIEPGFNSDGFKEYQKGLANETFDTLIEQIKALNREISEDKSLGQGFRIGHSYFCGRKPDQCTTDWMRSVVEFDILPMLAEYWFDEPTKLSRWEKNLRGVFDDE